MLPEFLFNRQQRTVTKPKYEYAVLMVCDCFGTGYVVHHIDHVGEAQDLRERLSLDPATIDEVWS